MKTVAKNIFILIAVILNSSSIFAQDKTLTIKGTVTDAEHNPIQYAVVENSITSAGVITGSNGNYIFTTTMPVLLEVTALGYKTIQTEITTAVKDTVEMNFTMEIDSIQLKTINIVSRHKPVVVNNAKDLRDFELKGNRLWLLYQNGKHSGIYIVDTANKTLASTDINFKTENLSATVNGLIYTLHGDSAYYYDWDGRRFSETKSSKLKLDTLMHNLSDYRNPYYYRYFISDCNSSVTYWHNGKTLKDTAIFYTYMSREAAKHNTYIYQEIRELEGINNPYPAMYNTHTLPLNDLVIDHTALFHIFELFGMIRDVYTVARVVNDSTYIFNFDNDSVYVFDTHNRFTKQMPLIFDEKEVKNKKKDILVDEEKKHCYFKYELHGITYLEEIDLTGKQKLNTQIIKYPYLKKIRISNGYAYFLYYNYYDYSSNYTGINNMFLSVYKQKLYTR
ncbi:MAG: carboxypeptidase-like regulatory domain-containing protein [Bacteroidia bacterium]